MKKSVKVGIFGAVVGAGAAGSMAALGNTLYNQIMLPTPRDPKYDEGVPAIQLEGREWARSAPCEQEITIQSVEGLQLWASYIPAQEETHRWVICMHGINDDHTSMGVYGKHYHENGWNVLLPDQRGFGHSEGDHVGWGFDERLDLVGWISWITRRDPESKILLHGVSLGGATVLMATGGALPENVIAAISDCAYTSIEAQLRHLFVKLRSENEYGVKIPPIPVNVMYQSLYRTCLRKVGFDLSCASPENAVARSKTPTLFIHGVQDTFVPSYMMKKLYHAAKCSKSFLWIPEAGHAVAVGTNPDLYWDSVSDFLASRFE